jgi:hypothetical protein
MYTNGLEELSCGHSFKRYQKLSMEVSDRPEKETDIQVAKGPKEFAMRREQIRRSL